MALTPAIRDIKQRFPRSVVRTFIDDRTFVSPTAVEVCDVRGAWDEWSTKLGLTENRDKTAIFHAKATGQRTLRAKGVVPDPCPKILGVELQGAKQRANTSRENKRIQESKNLPAKSTCLPLSWWEKQKVLNGAVLGKVTWGWMFHCPPDAQLQKLQTALIVVHSMSTEMPIRISGPFSEVIVSIFGSEFCRPMSELLGDWPKSSFVHVLVLSRDGPK